MKIVNLGNNFRMPQLYIFKPYPNTPIWGYIDKNKLSFPKKT